LIDEHGMRGVSYPVVRAYVADRKPQIRVGAGRRPVNMFIPQTHQPGAEAEVDFGEVTINLRGELVTCVLFAFRPSFSARRCTGLASGGSEAFLEGHVHAFTTLGGVPTDKIRYDNLRAAVAQVLGFPGSGSKRRGGPRSGLTTGSLNSTVLDISGPRPPRRQVVNLR
jgi:transposase